MILSRSIKKILLTIGLFPFLASCATLVHGTRQEIPISTNPSGALVSDGETTTETPAIFNLKRGTDHVLTITKPGYHTENIKLAHVISEVVAGNLIFGGLIGWGIDAISGAQWRLEPEVVTVTLRPLGHGEVAEQPLMLKKEETPAEETDRKNQVTAGNETTDETKASDHE